MIEKKIIADTEKAGDAFLTLVNSQSETMAGFVNTIISADGTPADAAIKVKDGAINIYQFAPDKGYVLAEQPEGSALPVQLGKYSELEVGKRYLIKDKEVMVLCVKTEDGKPDAKLGGFKTINDAVIGFTDPSVDEAFKNWSDREAALEKRDKKAERRLQRLAGGKIEEAEVVSETPAVETNE